jgi:hypothetical protein
VKTIDIRLTLTPAAFAAVLARLTTAPRGHVGDRCHEVADVMRRCAMFQREFREAAMGGRCESEAMDNAEAARRLVPLPMSKARV